MNSQNTKSDIFIPLLSAVAMSFISISFTIIALYFAIPDEKLFTDSLPIAIGTSGVLPILFGFPVVKYFRFQQQKIEHINNELNKILRFDTLTNVLTRKTFFNETEAKINASTKGVSHAALFIDIDHFKKLNDTFGHALGDKTLKIVGQVLNENLRENNISGRLGGEEFAIYFNNVSESQIQLIAYQILTSYESAAKAVDAQTTNSTLSIGAVISHQVDNIDSLLVHADQLLYQAKANGRNQIVFKNIDVDTVASSNIVESIVRKPRKNGTSSPAPSISAA